MNSTGSDTMPFTLFENHIMFKEHNVTSNQNLGNITLPGIKTHLILELPQTTNSTEMGTTEKAIWMYVSLFILIPGIVGNILTVLLMSRRKFGNGTTAWYLIALAVSDTGVLLSGLLRRWLSATLDFDWRTLSTASCRIGVFATYVSCHISAWIVVAVTIERLIVVKFPHHVQTLVTKKNVIIVLTLIVILSICLDCHFLWSFDYHPFEFHGRMVQQCHVTKKYKHFYYNIWAWFDMCAYSLFPFCFLLVGNICILVRLAKLKMKTHQVKNIRQGILAKPWMTTTLLCLSFTFIVTTLPQPVGFVVYYRIGNQNAYESEEAYNRWNTIYAVLNQLFYINHAIHFPLYCVTGSVFRQELAQMFCCNQEKHVTKHTRSQASTQGINN